MSKNYVISGNAVVSNHDDEDQATNAAIALAKQGKTITVVATVKTIAPNTGVKITDAAGNVTEAD